MATTKDSFAKWQKGADMYQNGLYEDCIEILSSITEPSARIYYNISCAHLKLGNLQNAHESLTDAVIRDNHMVLAFFQRGVVNMKLDRLQEAEQDFRKAIERMHDCLVIDYKQLGLRGKCYRYQILFNQALIHVNRQRYKEALELLQKAGEVAGGLMHEKEIKYVTDLIANKQYKKPKPMEMSMNCIFHPPKSVISNLDKRQYLLKAKVVAAYDLIDTSTDFNGTKRADQLRLERLTPKSSPTAMWGFIKQIHQANKHEGKKVGKLSHAHSTKILQDVTSTSDMTKSITLGCTQEEREMSTSILNLKYSTVHKLCFGSANLICAISLSSSSENIFGRSENHRNCHGVDNIEEDAAIRNHVKEKGIKARSHPLLFLNKPGLVDSPYGNNSATITRPPPPSYPPPSKQPLKNIPVYR
ncbi:hypothetical protein CHS0354_008206 [Potamilus streckersoni]|uniref:Uncharacterized protein n=1 Tax=Potamilus streckersoni TaxID=2493646 RepID=A0AAE0RWI2_9BIVA|nr:hypothetical protein CHS0354_008206 [Potamilus streckersoni]